MASPLQNQHCDYELHDYIYKRKCIKIILGILIFCNFLALILIVVEFFLLMKIYNNFDDPEFDIEVIRRVFSTKRELFYYLVYFVYLWFFELVITFINIKMYQVVSKADKDGVRCWLKYLIYMLVIYFIIEVIFLIVVN